MPWTPSIEEAIPEGLSALWNWNPNVSTHDITSYKLTASVPSGLEGVEEHQGSGGVGFGDRFLTLTPKS